MDSTVFFSVDSIKVPQLTLSMAVIICSLSSSWLSEHPLFTVHSKPSRAAAILAAAIILGVYMENE